MISGLCHAGAARDRKVSMASKTASEVKQDLKIKTTRLIIDHCNATKMTKKSPTKEFLGQAIGPIQEVLGAFLQVVVAA